VKLVLDSGALIALERNDRSMWRRLKTAALTGQAVVTHGAAIGQAWRGRGPRQALLAKALQGIDVRPVDAVLGRAAGELLASARSEDVVYAALVLLATDGDRIATTNVGDLAPLAAAAGRHVELIPV
jgi:hypothetical protein